MNETGATIVENMWGLDASTNRALQDKPPGRKFLALSKWQQTGAYPVWPRDQWSITKDEVQEYIEIDALLNNNNASIHAGMQRFHTLVTNRETRLLDHTLECVPDAKWFAAEAPIDPAGPSHEQLDRLADRVGISPPPPPPPSSQGTISLPPPWNGREKRVEELIKEATKRHTRRTNPKQTAFPWGVGSGFDGRRYLPLKGPCPHVAVGIVARFAQSDHPPVWLKVEHTRDGFATVTRHIMDSTFAVQVRTDGGHMLASAPHDA